MAQASRPAAPLNPGEFDFASRALAAIDCRLFADFPKASSGWPPAARSRRGGGSPTWSQRRLGDATPAHRVRAGHAGVGRAAGTREQLDPDRNEGYLVTGTIPRALDIRLTCRNSRGRVLPDFSHGTVRRGKSRCWQRSRDDRYALLTDLQPPVVRATILVVAGCIALWTGRRHSASTCWLPRHRRAGDESRQPFLAGPQLSFLAVATMIAFQPLLEPQPIVDPLDRLIAASRPWPVRVGKRMAAACGDYG